MSKSVTTMLGILGGLMVLGWGPWFMGYGLFFVIDRSPDLSLKLEVDALVPRGRNAAEAEVKTMVFVMNRPVEVTRLEVVQVERAPSDQPEVFTGDESVPVWELVPMSVRKPEDPEAGTASTPVKMFRYGDRPDNLFPPKGGKWTARPLEPGAKYRLTLETAAGDRVEVDFVAEPV